MGRSRKTDRELKNTLDVIKEGTQQIVENTGRTNEKLDSMKDDISAVRESSQTVAANTERTNEKLEDMGSDVSEIKKSTTSKLSIIIAVITLLVAVSGISVVGVIDRLKAKQESDFETVTNMSESEPEPEVEPEPVYEIYLYPEYSTFDVGVEVDMTATLNFEADAVSIIAHLASGKEDTLELFRKNTTEWQKKVVFNETGIHEIVVTAIAPNGEVVENSVEVEVTPISIDMDIDVDIINQLINS